MGESFQAQIGRRDAEINDLLPELAEEGQARRQLEAGLRAMKLKEAALA
jgi:hypothetical protein